MWSAAKKFYDYLITFPERLYPFSEIGNNKEKITGDKAYKFLAEKNKRLYNDAYSLQSPKLLLWRQVFHIVGSTIFVLIADQMFRHLSFFNGFAFLVLVSVSLAVQEFYLQSKYYDQNLQKSVIDFTTWMLPILLYIVL